MLTMAAATKVEVARRCKQWKRSTTWMVSLEERWLDRAPLLGVLNPEESEGSKESRA